MHLYCLRAGALVLALVLPTTAHAVSASPYGPVPPPSPDGDATVDAPTSEAAPEAPDARAAEPQPAPEPEPAPAIASSEPVPAPAVIEPAQDDDIDREALAAAGATQELGGTAMAVTGGFTVVGVVLILAGFGATGAALEKHCGGGSTCGAANHDVNVAARVTLSGLVITTLGAVGLVGGIIAYGVGHSRVVRARRGRLDSFGFAPSRGGGTLALRGRF